MIEVNVDVCTAKCMCSERSPEVMTYSHIRQRVEREEPDVLGFKWMRLQRTASCSAMKHK